MCTIWKNLVLDKWFHFKTDQCIYKFSPSCLKLSVFKIKMCYDITMKHGFGICRQFGIIRHNDQHSLYLLYKLYLRVSTNWYQILRLRNEYPWHMVCTVWLQVEQLDKTHVCKRFLMLQNLIKSQNLSYCLHESYRIEI